MSHHRIASIDREVRITFNVSITDSGSERVKGSSAHNVREVFTWLLKEIELLIGRVDSNNSV